MTDTPPRLAERCLGWLLPRGYRDEALDDLADLYARRAAEGGATCARRWYWRQVLPFALRIRVALLVGGPLQEPRLPPLTRNRSERMRALLTDVRYSARSLWRTPGFALVAVLTLALGIGANTAIFSVVQSVLLRPLPFPEPDRIVELQETRTGRELRASFAHDNFWDLRTLNRAFASVGAIAWGSTNLGGTAEPRRVSLARVSSGFFETLRAPAVLGRLFREGDDAPGSDPAIVVLSHALWTTQFGSDPSILDGTVSLDGTAYRVIGVLPPGTPWLDAADLFVPLIERPGANRDSWELGVIARLAPGVTLEAARADLDAVARRIGEAHPEVRDIGFVADSTEEWVASPGVRRALWVLMGAVGFLLLIACVNLANMLLARATTRVRERALRSALGATRGRVLQLAAVDALLLGTLGSALGVGLAVGLLRYLRAANPGNIPRLGEARIDGWVLMVALGAGLLTSLVAGVAPASRLPLGDLVGALRDGERSVAGSRNTGRLRRALVAVEVALSIILLVGAGLLLRSFTNVLGVDRGFRTENRVMFSVNFPVARTSADEDRNAQQLVDLVARMRAIPQVASAAAVSLRPLGGSGTGLGFGAADRPDATGRDIPWAGWRLVTSDFFTSMGVPLLFGRDFTEQDVAGQDAMRVIISRRIAELLWPGESAVGRTIDLWKGQNSRKGEVIGVVGDMRDWGLTNDPTYSVYIPVYRFGMTPAHFVVHTPLPLATLMPLVRSALAEVSPMAPAYGAQALDDLVGDSVASQRFTMLLLVTLAGVAMLLAVGGVYGVLSYTVSQRRAEVGVRLALGASRASVMRMVMAQGMAPVAIGLVAGLAGALALSRFLQSLLFGMTPADLPTYAGVALLLAASAALSCWLPAREATRVDVLAALREE